jgi:hypothetical protein
VSSFRASQDPSVATEHRILKVASKIALDHARKLFWISFASFNAVDQGKSDPGSAEVFWEEQRPYVSCLVASTLIYHALVEAIANHPDNQVEKHAGEFKLMTCAQHATSELGYQAIVAICFGTRAIVIDHSLNSDAFRVVLGQVYEMEPYVPLFSEKGQERFSCFLDDDGNHTMTMDSAISSSFPPLSFTDRTWTLVPLYCNLPSPPPKRSSLSRAKLTLSYRHANTSLFVRYWTKSQTCLFQSQWTGNSCPLHYVCKLISALQRSLCRYRAPTGWTRSKTDRERTYYTMEYQRSRSSVRRLLISRSNWAPNITRR